MSQPATRFGVAYLVLWCQFAFGLLMLASQMLRMIPEQLAFAIGLLVADGQNAPERVLLLLHMAGYTVLGATLWMWSRDDPRTWLMMKVAAPWQCLLAPAGLPVAGLLWWLARHPQRDEASSGRSTIAGNRRLVVLLTWALANGAVFLAGFAAFLLLGMPPLWFLAMLAASLPMAGALLVLMAPSKDGQPEAVMPRLPELIQS